uniref:Uncharacterized protein n=1 Tax=Romanomermis culicivorax TaxID=13658 RepID=A0A915I7R7_ROMCU
MDLCGLDVSLGLVAVACYILRERSLGIVVDQCTRMIGVNCQIFYPRKEAQWPQF